MLDVKKRSGRARRHLLAGCATLLATMALQATAAPPALSVPISSQENENGSPQGFSGFLSSLHRSNYLLGDMFGLRTTLSQYGISLAVQETSEILGNATGGIRQGADYDGLTQAILQLDTQRAFGWHGGLFNVSALQIHGRNLSADNLGTIQTASGIEADRATRLWELWYDQKFLSEDRADIKVGQQSVDQEFMVSQNAGYFINTMFGWPALPSYDMPGGGPAYPLSAIGVRLRYRPIDALAILAGVYSGNPAPSSNGDPQKLDGSGTSFPTNGGTLALFELQWTYPAIGAMVYPGSGAPLGHTYKLGLWYDSDDFADQRYDSNGMPLAAPASNGIARDHRGDYSIYAVADQMIWRAGDRPGRNVSVFARVMGAPQADRNLVSFSANAGLTMHYPFPTRPDDTLGIGMGYARVSTAVTGADQDTAYYTLQTDPTAYSPVRHDETYVELTYQYQMRPWWQLQPDLQYVFTPGGGIANPDDPSQEIKNELVLGVRTNVLF